MSRNIAAKCGIRNPINASNPYKERKSPMVAGPIKMATSSRIINLDVVLTAAHNTLLSGKSPRPQM